MCTEEDVKGEALRTSVEKSARLPGTDRNGPEKGRDGKDIEEELHHVLAFYVSKE